MNEFYEKAIERLRDDKGLNGNKERAMAPAVREALEKFCEEDGDAGGRGTLPGAGGDTGADPGTAGEHPHAGEPAGRGGRAGGRGRCGQGARGRKGGGAERA